jgi:hypothetical protein
MKMKTMHAICLVVALFALADSAWAAPVVNQKKVAQKMRQLHLPFVANAGQKDKEVAYYAKTFGGTIFVTQKGEIVYALPEGREPRKKFQDWTEPNKARKMVSLTERLIGGKVGVIKGLDFSESKVSYFIGNDQSKWQSSLPTYDRVTLGEVYDGVELTLKAHGNNVEKLFSVQPGADPGQIKVGVRGAKGMRVNEAGALVIETVLGEVLFTKPTAYQEIKDVRKEIAVAYRVETSKGPEQAYSFSVGGYDKTQPLIIDPLLQSTYVGGDGQDYARAVAIHPATGDIYLAGSANATDFPGTAGGAQPTHGGGFSDVFVSRLTADLTRIVQSTYLGGSGEDDAYDLVIHPTTRDVYVAGWTGSTDFPGTAGGVQTTYGGRYYDAFVSRLTADLTMLNQSTYLGGSSDDYGNDMEIHPTTGAVYLAGSTGSSDFPVTASGLQTTNAGETDIFVSRLSADLTMLNQSTYLGGSKIDGSFALEIHPTTGEIYLAGSTNSNGIDSVGVAFPGTAGGAQATKTSYDDNAVVSRLNENLTGLVQSTYLGGSSSEAVHAMKIHPTTGEVYVAGHVWSTDFPGTAGGAQATKARSYDAVVSRLNADLTGLVQSTYLGGNGYYDIAYAMEIHPTTGDIYLVGETESTDFPGTAGGIQPTSEGGDIFASRLTADLTRLVQSTYLGGISRDVAYDMTIHPTTGDIYLVGWTDSPELPGTTGGVQPTKAVGGHDAFVFQLTDNLSSKVSGPHFRFGHLTWQADEVGRVQFALTGVFRRDGYSGSGSDFYPVTGDVILEDIGNTNLCFGDGACTGTLYFTVTAYDSVNNWIQGVGGVVANEGTIGHNYLAAGTFVAYSESCCRIEALVAPNAHINNPSRGYRIETQVTLQGQ